MPMGHEGAGSIAHLRLGLTELDNIGDGIEVTNEVEFIPSTRLPSFIRFPAQQFDFGRAEMPRLGYCMRTMPSPSLLTWIGVWPPPVWCIQGWWLLPGDSNDCVVATLKLHAASQLSTSLAWGVGTKAFALEEMYLILKGSLCRWLRRGERLIIPLFLEVGLQCPDSLLVVLKLR